MKKVFMTLAVVLIGMTATNAQLVIGGGLGLGGQLGSSSKVDGVITAKADDSFQFNLLPKVGYMFKNGKMEVGAKLALEFDKYTAFTIFKEAACKDVSNYNLNLSFVPYFRYFFLQKGCFNLGLEANLRLGGSVDIADKYFAIEDLRTQKEANEKTKDAKKWIKDSKPTYFSWALGVKPVMMFNLTKHCYMDITMDAIGIGIWGNRDAYQTKDAKDNITTVVDSEFGGGLNLMDIANDLITVGFAYKF